MANKIKNHKYINNILTLKMIKLLYIQIQIWNRRETTPQEAKKICMKSLRWGTISITKNIKSYSPSLRNS